MPNREVYFCDCADPSHQLHISHFHWGEDMEPEFGIVMHLNRMPLLKRIKYAIKYIFGWQSKHGAFSEMMLETKDVERLRDSCIEFIEKAKKPEFQHNLVMMAEWAEWAANNPDGFSDELIAKFAAFKATDLNKFDPKGGTDD